MPKSRKQKLSPFKQTQKKPISSPKILREFDLFNLVEERPKPLSKKPKIEANNFNAKENMSEKFQKPKPLSKKPKIEANDVNTKENMSERYQKPKPLSKKSKFSENGDMKIFQEKETCESEKQNHRRITNDEIWKVLKFLENDQKLKFIDEEF